MSFDRLQSDLSYAHLAPLFVMVGRIFQFLLAKEYRMLGGTDQFCEFQLIRLFQCM